MDVEKNDFRRRIQQNQTQLSHLERTILEQQMRKNILDQIMGMSSESASSRQSEISGIDSTDLDQQMHRIREFMGGSRNILETKKPEIIIQDKDDDDIDLPYINIQDLNRQKYKRKQNILHNHNITKKLVSETLCSLKEKQQIKMNLQEKRKREKIEKQKERMKIRSQIFEEMKKQEKEEFCDGFDYNKYTINLPSYTNISTFNKGSSYNKYLKKINKSLRKCDRIHHKIEMQKIRL